MSFTYGNYSENGSEYIITTPKIPRHWYNYLWNDSYIAFASQVGFGEGFAQDSAGRRIPLVSNRNLYIIDQDTGEYWTANGLPISKGYTAYRCVHGLGFTEIDLEFQSVETSFRIFVPEQGHCEIWSLKIKNKKAEACHLKIIPYIRTEMDGSTKPQGYNTATGAFDPSINAVLGKGFSSFEKGQDGMFFGYLTGNVDTTGYDSRKNAFIGTYGEESAPEAIQAGGCTNSDCISEKLCFALENTIKVGSGELIEVHFIAGVAFDKEEIVRTRRTYFSEDGIEAAYSRVLQKFSSQIGGVKIQTPDVQLNHLFNHWLMHQTNLGSRWARVRHNGFRDMTSDNECLGAVNPDLAWERLKRVLTFQYSNGYAPRTFIDGSVRDNQFADNTVWLTFAVYSLLMERGRMDMLDELVEFNDGSQASVYEHIKRSVDFLWNFRGLHGLIKIWGGDWNDCMNKAGLQGKGVSVWLSIAWYRANSQFAEIAGLRGETADIAEADRRACEMRNIVDQWGWDGDYYLTAYTDHDEKLGSRECDEGKLFLIPQLWAVLSGISCGDKAIRAMEEVDKTLERDLGTLISWPAYTYNDNRIGIMTQKPPGTQENGGVYLHTSAWKLAVDSMLKRNDKVQEGLEKILPFNSKWAEKKAEPYILCNSYFPEEAGYRYGTPGQSWRTASGPWLVKALINYVFGLKPEMGGLRLEPCLPPDWKTCSISKNFRKATYHITYEQIPNGSGIAGITANGIPCDGNLLPYVEGETFEVKVVLC